MSLCHALAHPEANRIVCAHAGGLPYDIDPLVLGMPAWATRVSTPLRTDLQLVYVEIEILEGMFSMYKHQYISLA